jgi:putative peptidoglycan lipid II flippase
LGLIVGVTVFYNLWGTVGLALGVVLGSILHFIVQLPEAFKSGWRYRLNFKFSQEVKKVLTLMIPRTIGLMGNQLNQVIITMIGSTLVSGSLAIFNLANNLQTLPSSIFGVSLAIAIFPIFNETLGRGDHHQFKLAFSIHFRRILFFIIPISVFILLLRAQLVRVILGSGNFDWSDTYYTAQTLGWFILSLFAQSLIPMLARSFYALEDTKTPVIISLIAVVFNICGSLYLSRIMGVEGLALAYSAAAIINLIALIVILRIRLGNLDDKKIIWSTFKISINSAVAGVGLYYALRIMADFVDMKSFIGILTQALAAGLVGLIIYASLSFYTNCEEIVIVKRFLLKYLKPLLAKKD